MDRHALPDSAPKQLESAIDITCGVPKQQVDQELPTEGVQLAHERVGSVASPADDQVGLAVHGRQEVAQLGHVELLIAVGQEHQVLVCRVESAGKRRAVATIVGVCDHEQMEIGLTALQVGKDYAGVVA